ARHPAAVYPTPFSQVGLVIQRYTCSRQRQAVDVEGLPHAVQYIGDTRRRSGITNPQAGQPIRLAQRARDQQVRVAVQIVEAIGQLAVFGKFDISLVQYHQHVRRDTLEEVLQRLGANPGTGRVVRVGDKDHASLLVDGFEHAVEVVTVIDGGHHAAFRTYRLGTNRIGREGMGAEDRIAARRQPAPCNQIDDVVGAVTQSDLLRPETETLGQLGLELKTAAIGVAAQLGQLGSNRFKHAGIGAQRILVAGKLDDPRRVDTQLAGQFINRFSGDVGRQFLHAWYSQGEEITGHSYKPQASSRKQKTSPLEARSLRLLLKYRLGIRAQHFQRHGFVADLFQHVLDQRILVVADAVDEEHIGPLATARRPRFDAGQVDAVGMERHQQLMQGARLVAHGNDDRGLVIASRRHF